MAMDRHYGCGQTPKRRLFLVRYGVDGGKGWATRMLCSQTCGCQDPGSDFISVQGCPFGYGNGDFPRPCQDGKDKKSGMVRLCKVEKVLTEEGKELEL